MVMHARKPQRLNDGYFEKHQSHSYPSSKYGSAKREYERDRSSGYRERELSPGGINNGSSGSYRQSPDLDSPRAHEMRDRGDRGDHRFNYIQKIRDRERDIYKKDKYTLDKRDRRGGDRESDAHRTNHDRLERRGVSKLSLSSNSSERRPDSNDRDRERERDLREIREKRDRERERERERERLDRGVDRERGSSASSSVIVGSTERNDRGERVARCGDWSEHVSSSGKMYYYNCKTEVSQWEKPKEWLEKDRNLSRDQQRDKEYRDKDRDREREDRFSRTAFSKHSNSRGNSRLRWNYDNDSGPPNHRRRVDGRINEVTDMDISPGDSTPTSEASYSITGLSSTHAVTGSSNASHNDQTSSSQSSTGIGLPNALPRLASHPNSNSNAIALSSLNTGGAASKSGPQTLITNTSVNSSANSMRKIDTNSLPQHHNLHVTPTLVSGCVNQVDHLNSTNPVTSKIGIKDRSTHLQLAQNSEVHMSGSNVSTISDISNHTSASRENTVHSPHYNLTRGMSPIIFTKNLQAMSSSNTSTISSLAINSNSSSNRVATETAYVQNCADNNSMSSNINTGASGSSGVLSGDGPPTPTQEFDVSGSIIETPHRKQENTTSGTLNTIQSVASTVQAGRNHGAEISPKLAKYFRADLIAHVTNWQADILEKQAQKCTEEAHMYGDIQLSKISAELKCARSLVRITEITATLQEQKIMYLRQQIRQLEDSKALNAFMSDDP